MNHIAKSFVLSDGTSYKSHSWELREDGYRRTALIVGNGLWPVSKEKRLISFLIDRGFRVLSLDLAFGSPTSPRTSLRAFRTAILAFAKEARPTGLPLYLIASSFSGGALLPVAKEIQGLAALALVAPVVEYPPLKLKKPPFFLSTAQLALAPEAQSGMPELLKGLTDGPSVLRFHKRDLRSVALEIASALEEPLGMPAAAFSGEDDPYLSPAGRKSLSSAGVRVYGYPRVRHEPAHDRYADNFFADLGSFLDEVEAGKGKAPEGM
jgi:predicted alpha/beta hydrolase